MISPAFKTTDQPPVQCDKAVHIQLIHLAKYALVISKCTAVCIHYISGSHIIWVIPVRHRYNLHITMECGDYIGHIHGMEQLCLHYLQVYWLLYNI